MKKSLNKGNRKGSFVPDNQIVPYEESDSDSGDDDVIPIVTATAVTAKSRKASAGTIAVPNNTESITRESTNMISSKASPSNRRNSGTSISGLENGRKGSISASSKGIKKPWPAALRQQIVKSFNNHPNAANGQRFLDQHKWPYGLQDVLFKSCKKIAMRFFIVDDSGNRF